MRAALLLLGSATIYKWRKSVPPPLPHKDAAMALHYRQTDLGPIVAALACPYVRDFPVSFEDGEQGRLKVYFPGPVLVRLVRLQVVVGLAAVDPGIVTLEDAAGNMLCTGTIPPSAPAGAEFVVAPEPPVVVEAGGYLTLTSSKPTPGGKVLVSIDAAPDLRRITP